MPDGLGEIDGAGVGITVPVSIVLTATFDSVVREAAVACDAMEDPRAPEDAAA